MKKKRPTGITLLSLYILVCGIMGFVFKEPSLIAQIYMVASSILALFCAVTLFMMLPIGRKATIIYYSIGIIWVILYQSALFHEGRIKQQEIRYNEILNRMDSERHSYSIDDKKVSKEEYLAYYKENWLDPEKNSSGFNFGYMAVGIIFSLLIIYYLSRAKTKGYFEPLDSEEDQNITDKGKTPPPGNLIKRVSNFIDRSFSAITAIPLILGMVTIVFMLCGPILVLMAVIPCSSYTINGQECSFREFWTSGAAIYVVATGLMMITLAYSVFSRKAWSKHLLMGFIVLPLIFALMNPDQKIGLGEILAIMLVYSFPAWYLYSKESIKAYFRRNGHEQGEQPDSTAPTSAPDQQGTDQ